MRASQVVALPAIPQHRPQRKSFYDPESLGNASESKVRQASRLIAELMGILNRWPQTDRSQLTTHWLRNHVRCSRETLGIERALFLMQDWESEMILLGKRCGRAELKNKEVFPRGEGPGGAQRRQGP